MTDPYQYDPTGRARAYSGANAGHSSYGYSQADNLAGTDGYDYGGDNQYFDGGTGVARRQSVNQYPDEYYYDQAQAQTNSYGMADGTGQMYSGSGVNGQYPPSYPADYPTASYGDVPNTPVAPYPTGAPYPNAGNQPYNPAAYLPQRHSTTAGTTSSYPSQADYRPQRHTAPGYSAQTYNPSDYANNAPYPTAQTYATGSRPLPMPGGTLRPSPSQSTYTGTYGGYSNNRVQYANYDSSGQQGPYSPGPPPVPSHSAPVQTSYQPPPPPPPPVPPQSPGYNQTSYGSPSAYNSAPYPTSSSTSAPPVARPETHYLSDSDSEGSAVSESSRHPLVRPPEGRELPMPPTEDRYTSQAAADSPAPGPSSLRDRRPLPQVPLDTSEATATTAAGRLYDEVRRDSMMDTMSPSTSGMMNGHFSGFYDSYYGNNDFYPPEDLNGVSEEEETRPPRDLPPAPQETDPDSSDENFGSAGMDLGGYGGGGFGGWEGPTFFGNTVADDGTSTRTSEIPIRGTPPVPLHQNGTLDAPAQMSPRRTGQFGIPDEIAEHPFPAHHASPRVDDYGLGGFVDPSVARRDSVRSYLEGDERDLPGRESDDSFPDMGYYPEPTGAPLPSPGINLNRPLPNPPTGAEPRPLPYPDTGPSRSDSGKSWSSGRPAGVYTPNSPGAFEPPYTSQTPYIPRATSLNTHSTTPVTVAPARSKTDGRIHPPKSNRTSVVGLPVPGSLVEAQVIPSISSTDLPAIPLTKKFDPRKLSTRDLLRCSEPWALSSIAAWLKVMTEGEQDLKEPAVADAITRLFVYNVPALNTADAETFAAKIVSNMLKEGTLIKEEEWVKFGDGEITGVIFQLTGKGCYSNRVHEKPDASGSCYAARCQRTVREFKLSDATLGTKAKMEDWATFWKLKKEDIENVNKKEVERQNNLHEIVQTEEEYMEQLKVLKVVYMEQIRNARPPILKPSKVDSFIKDVFGGVDAVRKASEEHLLPQLQFRQREQGPWIVGFSDIFREWIRKAKKAYLDYAHGFPKADMLVRREAERNLLFKNFLDQCRQDPRTKRLDYMTFLKGPITRLQRYSLLLATVHKHTLTESEEKQNLERAIEEIKEVTRDCDSKVDEMGKHVQMLELEHKLIMRDWGIKLRLDEKGRELIFQGELQRTGRSNRFTWLETHCILFDHYLILAKAVTHKDGSGKRVFYDVSRMPIPMDLLILESTDDEPVIRSTASKLGISAPAAAARVDPRNRHNTLNAVPTLQHTNSSSSVASTATAPGRLVTNLEHNGVRDDKILYPFRIKHLRDPLRQQPNSTKTEDNTYILYAHTAKDRQDWCEKIIFAKEKHAASLHAQNANPFKLKVIADSAFAYDSSTPLGPRPIRIRGTPLDMAITEVEKMYDGEQRPNPVCRAMVNCATTFTAEVPNPGNPTQGVVKQMIAVGTDFGVFVSVYGEVRQWHKAINTTRVTQITVLEDFKLLLVLADKALVAYHLDHLIHATTATEARRRPPQRLSGTREVGFFTTGRMKDRTLVFYKKRENLSSTFKVLEPVIQRNTEQRSRWGRRGKTEYFREFDEFYIPTECFGINLFHSSLSIQTSKGFEVMTLDKKQPFSVPELKAAHVVTIAQRLQNQKPLGMFRLSDIEFLLCYEECAVYVDKHGDVARSIILEFIGRAKTVASYGVYILIFDADFVEVRNAENGRLRQVIAGRDVRCIDDAGGYGGVVEEGRGVKVAMAHPDVEGRQLVVELVLNEGQMD